MAILDNQELNVKANANAIEADMNASHCQDDFHQWFHVSPLQGSPTTTSMHAFHSTTLASP